MAGYEDGGLPLPVEGAQNLPELRHALRVQAVDGLVQDEKIRVVHQGQCQPQPLLHAQGECLELLFPRVRQIHLLQHLVHHMLPGDTPLQAVILQVFPRGEEGGEGGDFNHDPGAGALLPHVLPRCAEQLHLAPAGLGLARDHPHQGGLACPVAAHQAIDIPPAHLHVHPVQGPARAIGLLEAVGRHHSRIVVHSVSAFLFGLITS